MDAFSHAGNDLLHYQIDVDVVVIQALCKLHESLLDLGDVDGLLLAFSVSNEGQLLVLYHLYKGGEIQS